MRSPWIVLLLLAACTSVPDGTGDSWPDDSRHSIDLPFTPDAVVADTGDAAGLPGDSSLFDDPGGGLPGDASIGDTQIIDIDESLPALEIHAVAPGTGMSSGQTTVTLDGSGFMGEIDVFFGSRKSPFVFVLADSIVNCIAPPSPPGVVDVSVVRGDGARAVLSDAFTYRRGLSIGTVEPEAGPSTGGTALVIRGTGFLDTPRLLLGGREVISPRVVDDGTMLAVSPPHDPGEVSLIAMAGDQRARLDGAFQYLDTPVAPSLPGMEVTGCIPGSGPVQGGTVIEVVGAEFRRDATVRVGGLPATRVEVLDGGRLRAVTPPGTPGPADVVVRVGAAEARLRNGFRYEAAGMEVLAVEPDSGSWSGGAWVRVYGNDLDRVSSVFFAGTEAPEWRLESATSLAVRVPRAGQTGFVTVMVLGRGGAMAESAFLYFDPTLRGGGTWGGPVLGDLNITVLNGSTGRGLPGAWVILGDDPHTPYQGPTDDRGQITMSDFDLRGRLTVHASKAAHSATTLAGFDARNATFYVSPVAIPENPGQPPDTGSGSSCRIKGRIPDFDKYFLKPAWIEGTVYGQCWTSTSSMFGGNPDPGPGAYVDSLGRFDMVARRGKLAVVCAVMVLDPAAGQPYPIIMGVRRGINCTGTGVDGIEVPLTIETDADLWFAPRSIPTADNGVNGPAFLGGWSLGDDGFLELLRRFERPVPDRVRFPNQPRAFDGALDGYGYSFYSTVSARSTMNGLPYAVAMGFAVVPGETTPVLLAESTGLQRLDTTIRRPISAMIPVDGGTRLLAADAGGRTYEFDGREFRVGPARMGRPILALMGDSMDDFMAAGARGMTWRVQGGIPTVLPTGVAVDITGISGLSVDDFHVVGGPFMLHWNGSSFRQEALDSPAVLRAVRVFPDGRVVAVGNGGAVVMGTPGAMFQVHRPVSADLRAVEGDSADDFLVVGSGGTLLHWKGNDVFIRTMPGSPLLEGMVVLGPDRVMVYGQDGAVFLVEGGQITDMSRPDVNLDILAAGQVDGVAVLAGRHFMDMPPFLGFPIMTDPLEGAVWRNRMQWVLPEDSNPSYHQLILSGPTGYPFWTVTAGGHVRSIEFPDFTAALGVDPIPVGMKRVNVTTSYSPGFSIDAYTSTDMGYYRRESFSVNLVSFQ